MDNIACAIVFCAIIWDLNQTSYAARNKVDMWMLVPPTAAFVAFLGAIC